MGKYKGKPKAAPPSKQSNTKHAEFSDDSDAVFSDEDRFENNEDNDEQEMEEILSPAEEEEEDEDDDGEVQMNWGNKRSAFFKQESSSDEEDEEDEDEEGGDEEAVRLLKKRMNSVQKEDLQIGGEDDDEDEPTGPVVVRKSRRSKALADEEADQVLASEAPEVLALLGEFSTKAAEIRDSIAPVLERLRQERESSTKEGIAYLETKTHLLLSYVLNVAFYLMYRAENGAAKAESHPVVSQLVRLRTLLEKLRPLDAKLKNELDELVRRAVAKPSTNGNIEDAEVEDEGDEEVSQPQKNGKPAAISSKHGFRPDLNDLMENGHANDFDDEEDDEKLKKKFDRQEHRKIARAQKSSLLRELQEEQSEAPTEVVDELRSAAANSKYEQDKRRYEEENFTRVRETKKDRAKLAKQEKRAAIHGGDLNTLVSELEEDEFTKFKDLLEDDEGQGASASRKSKGALSMHLNEMEQARKVSKSMFQGGDDDVIPDKRRFRQQQEDKHLQDEEAEGREHNQVDQEDDDVEVDEEAEHPYYRETVKKRKQASQERADSYQFPKRFAPEPVRIVEAGKARSATREMMKNRGLTPHRSKESRNPRKHMRDKYEAKVKARRGQVRDIRSGEGDYYQGEKTGIRSNIVRSRQAGKI